MEIPNNKRVEYSLQYIHGIGRTNARQILNDLSFENKLTKDFSEEELTILRAEVSKYMTEGDLVSVIAAMFSLVLLLIFFRFELFGYVCYVFVVCYFALLDEIECLLICS